MSDYYGTFSTFPHSYGKPKTTQQSVLEYLYLEWKGRRGLVYYEINTYGMFSYQEPLLAEAQDRHSNESSSTSVIRCELIIARLDQFLECSVKLYDKLKIWGLVDVTIEIDDVFGLRMDMDAGSPFPSEWLSHQDKIKVSMSVYKSELVSKRLEILKRLIREIFYGFNLNIQEEVIEKCLSKHNRLDLATN